MNDLPMTPKVTSVLWTTRRAMATWSFAIGLWSTLVFWWYPYSVCVASVGLFLGLLSLVMGWRAGKDGEHLAWGGVLLCANTLTLTVLVFRGMQLFFGDIVSPIYP